MAKTSYGQKLRDPRWQMKRLEVLKRDNATCQMCGDKETELHVHHKSYHGNPWDAPDEELQTLCKHCHAAISKAFNSDTAIHGVIKSADREFLFITYEEAGGQVGLAILRNDEPKPTWLIGLAAELLKKANNKVEEVVTEIEKEGEDVRRWLESISKTEVEGDPF